jgi:transcriptional regulator with XRE-family HTH domain
MAASERLKTVRLKLGLSQKEMGERLNVTQAAYNRYEKEVREIPQEMLLALFQIGIDITWLLTGTVNHDYIQAIHNSFDWDNTVFAADKAIKLNITIPLLRAISDGEISPTPELYERIMGEKGGQKTSANNTTEFARLKAEIAERDRTIANLNDHIAILKERLAPPAPTAFCSGSAG